MESNETSSTLLGGVPKTHARIDETITHSPSTSSTSIPQKDVQYTAIGADSTGNAIQRNHLRDSFHWKFELLSMFVSVGALLAIIAVLFAYDGKSMANWHAIIQPNTVISALSTLAKSSMLMVIGQGLGQLKWEHFGRGSHRLADFDTFDSASQGPWGSLQLLYHVNFKALAASAGAIITILALAMDPFVQQVIHYEARLVDVTNITSSIGAARRYDLNSQLEASSDAAVHYSFNKVRDTQIIGSMYQSVFGNNNEMSFDCISGNCKWSPFESLGICNTCKDVTEATNATRICDKGEPAPWNNATVNITCAYETPSGYLVNGSAVNWNFMRSFEMYHTLWNSTTFWQQYPRPNDNMTYPSSTVADIVTIAALKFDSHDDESVTKPFLWLEEAYECSLTWCAKEYTSTQAHSGSLTDQSTSTKPLIFLPDAPCDGNSSETMWNQYAYTKDPNNTVVYIYPGYKEEDLPYVNCNQSNGQIWPEYKNDTKAFWINRQDSLNIGNAIGSIFTTDFSSISRPGDDAARSLFNSKSFPETMDQIARSMTNVGIRSGPNSTDVLGTVQLAEQHIYVRWEWMILPAALVGFSIAFLLVSMMAAAKGRVWKGSSLPSFYHGLSGWNEQELRSTDVHQMERDSKHMWASLREDEKGNLKMTRAAQGRIIR